MSGGHTSAHLDDRLTELLLGELGDDERQALEAHVAGCEPCARALADAADAFAGVALALAPEPPPPSLRARLLADATLPRLHAMIAPLAALFDVTRARARALIERIDDAAAWEPGPLPASWLMRVADPGPALAGAFAALIKLGPGVRWPVHRHLGQERMLVLAGGFRQDDGVEVRPGQLHVMEAGSAHAFTIFDDEPCVAAAVVHVGIEFDDPSIEIGGVT